MLLTVSTTHQPATDLGYLLHKNPSRLHSFELSFGQAHVFYPEALPSVVLRRFCSTSIRLVWYAVVKDHRVNEERWTST